MSGVLTTLQVGQTSALRSGGKVVPSAFVKRRVVGPVWLSELGLGGDEQADLKAHGGLNKAVCVYPGEHYAYWAERLARALPEAAFGENFTTRELTENTVHIGDIFEVGEATVQVSQPRQPCFKLAARHEESKLALWVQETGRTGFYFRCLEPGWLRTRLSPSSSGARMASPSPRRTASCTRIRTMRRAPSGYSLSPNSPQLAKNA